MKTEEAEKDTREMVAYLVDTEDKGVIEIIEKYVS